MAKKTWEEFVSKVFADCQGHIIGWQGQQVAIDLDGLQEAPQDEQFGFLFQMATRGLKRVCAEKVSAKKTFDEAVSEVTYQAGLGDYQAGVRVGAIRLDSPEACAKSLYVKNLTALLKDKSTAAQGIADKFGLSLTEKGKLDGTDSEEFQAYLSAKATEEYWAAKGVEEFARLEAERRAKVGKKAAQAHL